MRDTGLFFCEGKEGQMPVSKRVFSGNHKVRLPASFFFFSWVKNQDRRLLGVNTKILAELVTPFCLFLPTKNPTQPVSVSFISDSFVCSVACVSVRVCFKLFFCLKHCRPLKSSLKVTWKKVLGGSKQTSFETYKS